MLRQARQDAVNEMRQNRSLAVVGRDLGMTRGRAAQIAGGKADGFRKTTEDLADITHRLAAATEKIVRNAPKPVALDPEEQDS